ncbi:MAG: FtsB family cell division protein [Georgenia sp.]
MSARRPTAPRTRRADGQPAAAPRYRPAARPMGAAAPRPATTPQHPTAVKAGSPGKARPSAPKAGSTPGKAPPTPATARAGGGRRALAFGHDDGSTPAPAISLRVLVIFLVALVAFVVLAPTLRYAVAQQEQLRSLNAEVDGARARNTDLQRRLELWQDPQYVQAQARDRLGYVMPGETPYIVVDPETVTGGENVADVEAAARAAARAAATPWYLRVWESVQLAGESGTGEEDPSGLTVPASEDPSRPTVPESGG